MKKHVEDNIFRQAKSVFKPNPTDFDKYIKQFYDEKFVEDGEVYNVEEKISEFEARKYLEIWNNIKTSFAHEKQRLSQLRSTGGATPEDQAKMSKILDVEPAEQLNLQKDLLFIETGEDVEDIFLAFKHFKLEWATQLQLLHCYFHTNSLLVKATIFNNLLCISAFPVAYILTYYASKS